MLAVKLDNTAKKYGREWIFRKLNLDIPAGSRLVVLGGNGSGKSTLLQTIAGFVSPNEGSVFYTLSGKIIDPERHHHYVSLASPYLQLIEDFTGSEIVTHTAKYKPFTKEIETSQVLEIAGLSHARDKFIRQYSSGMKQRLKLALAILADTPLLLLDEPLSNLDRDAVLWYKDMIGKYCTRRTVIVCSNAQEEEHFFCDSRLLIQDYK